MLSSTKYHFVKYIRALVVNGKLHPILSSLLGLQLMQLRGFLLLPQMSIFFHNATHNLLSTFMQKVHLQALFLLTAMAATGCSDWERMSSNPSTVCLQGRIPGKGDLSPAWTLTCWGRQVSPVSPWTRESCSPACASCLPFHCIPAFACTSVPALLPWSWQCARVQSICGAVCALCCDNLTSPQGTS